MKAVVWNKYGPPEVLKIKDLPIPALKDDAVLIKIHASTVTLGDCEMRSMRFIFVIRLMLRLYFGIFRPRETVLGQELSGQVVEVGKNVTGFSKGDRVAATPGMTFGGYAQFIALKADRDEGVLMKLPENVSYEEGAGMLVGGLEAQNFIGAANLQPGQHILINGAGGSIGTMAIQLAKLQGAVVTAVDRADKLEFLKAVGADYTIDYQSEDYTKGETKYDAILDVVGKGHYGRGVKCLNPGGYYLIANPSLPLYFRSRLTKWLGKAHVYMTMTAQSNEKAGQIASLIESGELKVYIDAVYPLDRIVQAHHYVEGGNKKGNLIIDID